MQREDVARVVRRVWGFDSLLPLQAEALDCVLRGRDSVVVLPTGGGKSLCFQAPALCREGVAVVVSPLIALMKDQVDALRQCGVAAAFANSTLARDEHAEVERAVRAGRTKLLYLAPERLLAERTLDFLKTVRLSFIAIDEAHCISSWGHDFRPEYRGLGILRTVFPDTGLHAFTATAAEPVRRDIAQQLRLRDPAYLVGSFDRPNLIYRVQRRANRLAQLRGVLDRHSGQSGIIYCISRKEVEQLAAALVEFGYGAVPYHAGMSDALRDRHQELFLGEQADTIVATVAFGMGVDKPNVRYVVHANMPKSLESYQQESGRAGRDGLAAECCLFYSGRDFAVWRQIIGEAEPAARDGALRALRAMMDFCTGVQCRHQALVEYFGERWERAGCGACDVCLGELDLVDDALVVAQKILSCVLRLGQPFGADYTAKVLNGSREQRILHRRHDQLSTWNLLSQESLPTIRQWIEQLVGQGFLAREQPFQTLEVTPQGWSVLRGQVVPRLLRPAESSAAARPAAERCDAADRGLFDELRRLREETAARLDVPTGAVFADTCLREMARRRPASRETFCQVPGVESADHHTAFVQLIRTYCRTHGLATDVPVAATTLPATPGLAALRAFPLFRAGLTIDQVARRLDRAHSTVEGYLAEFVRFESIVDPSPWVDARTTHRIVAAARQVGLARLKPIYEQLGGTVSYQHIRIVAACLQNDPERPA